MKRYAIRGLLMLIAGMLPAAGQSGEWKPLFNGTDTTGWEQVGPGRFVVEKGTLKTEGGMGLMWYTREKFGNAVIRVVYNPTKGSANSGVFIRMPEKPKDPWAAVNQGYEVQIDSNVFHNDYHITGVLYSLTKALAYPQKAPGEWNIMEITLDGKRTVVYLNDRKVTDYTEGQPVPVEKKWYEPDRGPRPASGYIGLQNHDDGAAVYFKEVSVKRLAK